MSDNNGQTYPFGEMVHHISERVQPKDVTVDRYVGLEHLDSESLKIRRWGSPADVGATKLRFYVGDIIFGKRRFYQRKLAVADFEGICSAHAMVLRAKPDVVLPEFLPFFLQSETFYERAISISVGSLSPTINWTTLKRQEFALPPLDEQRRIAEILTAVEDVIIAKQNVVEKLVKLKASFIKHIFQNGLSDNVQKESAIGKVPKSWNVSPLETVCEFLDNKRIPLSKSQRAKRPGIYPYYGASGIVDQIDDYIFDEPLILLSEDGANLVARVTPVAFQVNGKIWVNNHAHVLRMKENNNIDFYTEYLESISYSPYITGTAQPKLNQKVSRGIPVPIPPTEEQKAIANRFDLINRNLDSANISIKETRALKNRINNLVLSKE